MVYRFVLLSDEQDNFFREIEIDSEATFLEFNNAILESAGYTSDQITSFFICNDGWEKEQEITLFEMDSSSEFDSYVMENTPLNEFVREVGQRLMFIFDNLNERAFFIELKKIILSKNLGKAVCTLKKGNAPAQLLDMEEFTTQTNANSVFDENFYGSDNYDEDELDSEGFSDLTFDDFGNEI